MQLIKALTFIDLMLLSIISPILLYYNQSKLLLLLNAV